MLDFIREQTKPDLVLWTGDSIPHNVGTLTADSNAQIMKNVTNMVAKELKDFRVYPALGNHDTFPQDIISMFKPRDNPTINDWDNSWLQFIPDEEQQKNFLDYGFYSLPLQDINGN